MPGQLIPTSGGAGGLDQAAVLQLISDNVGPDVELTDRVTDVETAIAEVPAQVETAVQIRIGRLLELLGVKAPRPAGTVTLGAASSDTQDLSWEASPTDGAHDAPTLYSVEVMPAAKIERHAIRVNAPVLVNEGGPYPSGGGPWGPRVSITIDPLLGAPSFMQYHVILWIYDSFPSMGPKSGNISGQPVILSWQPNAPTMVTTSQYYNDFGPTMIDYIVGVQIIEYASDLPPDFAAPRQRARRTFGNPTGLGGVTWPEAGSYYWGAQLADDTGEPGDVTPIAPLNVAGPYVATWDLGAATEDLEATVGDLMASTEYSYRVIAENAGGAAEPSDVVTGTTEA